MAEYRSLKGHYRVESSESYECPTSYVHPAALALVQIAERGKRVHSYAGTAPYPGAEAEWMAWQSDLVKVLEVERVMIHNAEAEANQ